MGRAVSRYRREPRRRRALTCAPRLSGSSRPLCRRSAAIKATRASQAVARARPIALASFFMDARVYWFLPLELRGANARIEGVVPLLFRRAIGLSQLAALS